jgi:protein-L-isoaspartate(D-aspartate) O-methyltransferase
LIGQTLSESKEDLILSLKREGILKSKKIEKALNQIRREDFIWPGYPKGEAYFDVPLPLGDTRQTISAPHMIVIMLEELELEVGQKVLEVGAGSGYNAALLGFITSGGLLKGSETFVTAVEINETLVKFASENIKRAGLADLVSIQEGDGSLGFPENSKEEIYDRILVTAGAPHVPRLLEKQLKPGGILLVPVGNLPYQTLVKETKRRKSEGINKEQAEFIRKESTPCMFVPLIGKDAYHF